MCLTEHADLYQRTYEKTLLDISAQLDTITLYVVLVSRRLAAPTHFTPDQYEIARAFRTWSSEQPDPDRELTLARQGLYGEDVRQVILRAIRLAARFLAAERVRVLVPSFQAEAV